MKKYYIAIAGVLLACSLGLNVFLLCAFNPADDDSITGTYVHGNDDTNLDYLILDEEGCCYFYNQLEGINEKGEYELKGQTVLLKNCSFETLSFSKDRLYVPDGKNILIYEKHNDVPIFINTQ